MNNGKIIQGLTGLNAGNPVGPLFSLFFRTKTKKFEDCVQKRADYAEMLFLRKIVLY